VPPLRSVTALRPWRFLVSLRGPWAASRPHPVPSALKGRSGESGHEKASDCLGLDGCAGDASTCLLLTRLPSRRTMPGVLRSVPAILRSSALLWSTAILRSGAVLCSTAVRCSTAILRSAAAIWSATSLLRLRLGQPQSGITFSIVRTRRDHRAAHAFLRHITAASARGAGAAGWAR
jgi:hypothetical protein